MTRQQLIQRLGTPEYEPVMVVENQQVGDIIALIKSKHVRCADDYDKIASGFWAGNVYQTCARLWTFCKNNIQYSIEDEETQTVSRPSVILSKGYGDCKHYSLFIAGVLDALVRQGKNIKWNYRFASYNPFDDTPGHVFVVVDDGEEIWIDPVLDEFDYHKPYVRAIDKTISATAAQAINGIYKNHSGSLSHISGKNLLGAATGQQTGQLIEKLSASAAAIPVYPVNLAIAAAGALVGFFLTTFGSKYTSSTQVRWLAQLYEYYVLGLNTTSDNHVSAANVQPAQVWFANVLGVPVYDRLRFNSLAGHTGAASIDNNIATRVADYLKYPDVIAAGVTYNQAYQAAQIAGSMNFSAPRGGWAGMTYAPSLIDNSLTGSSSTILPATPTNALSNMAASMGVPSWVLYGGIAVVLYLVLTSGKKH